MKLTFIAAFTSRIFYCLQLGWGSGSSQNDLLSYVPILWRLMKLIYDGTYAVILARDNRSSKPFIQKDWRIHIVESKKKKYFVLSEVITCRSKTFVTNPMVLFCLPT